MTSTPRARCDCCGLSVNIQAGDDCPRCGYPVALSKEEQFLQASIQHLQRVAAYGGAALSVTRLIQRYQDRLNNLHRLSAMPTPAQTVSQPLPTPKIIAWQPTSDRATTPSPQSVLPGVTESDQSAPITRRMFSLASFFADQTINIVASLGAFLILIGSLSFVVTTANLLLSFLVMFIVHAVFGVTGIVSYRARSFRTVAVIYTAIFALLVPLVGFSGYRLVSGNLLQLSTPTLITIAAVYAAIVYGALAIYQKFKPFGYLAVVALAVADLAVASALSLAYWWWPGMLLLLAFPALASSGSNNTRPFTGKLLILREPVRVLMFTCVAICGVSIIFTGLYIVSIGYIVKEIGFSLVSMTLLLLAWTCLFIWRTKRTNLAAFVPYLFLGCVLAVSYALEFRQVGYALALTLVAFLYHGLNRVAPRLVRTFDTLGWHLDGLALVLVSLVPFITLPILPLQLFGRAYVLNSWQFQVTRETMIGLAVVATGFVLTLSVMFSRAGLRKTPVRGAWCWLLLLSGFLLNCAYSVIVLSLNAEPVWCFLGLTLACIVGTVAVRRFAGASWANPLDVFTLGEVALTLLLSFQQSLDSITALLLSFAVLSYCVLLYQRRQTWLFVTVGFAIAALLVPTNPFWVLAWLASATVVLAFGVSRFAGRDWAMPLYVVAVLTAVMMGLAGYHQSQLFASTWVLLAFALLIYLLGVAENLTLLMWLAPFFATWSVLDSALLGDLYRPPVVALLCAAIGVGTGCLRSVFPALSAPVNKLLRYALPFYAVALAAAVLTGVYGALTGVNYPFYAAVPAALLVYALVVNGVLLFERKGSWVWLVAGFAGWSTFLTLRTTSCLGLGYVDSSYAASCSLQVQATTYCLTAIALVTGILGLLVGRLVKQAATTSTTAQVWTRFTWSWPWYLTTLVATAVIVFWNHLVSPQLLPATVEYGSLLALIALSLLIMLLERAPEMLVLPVGLAAWTLAQTHWNPWQQMIAYSLLCVLIFASQFIWKVIPSATRVLPSTRLHITLGIGGQVLVVLAIILQGGLFADTGLLAHVGAGSLFVLATLLFCYGRLQPNATVQHWCYYGTGLLVALVVPWELSALGQTHIDVLALAPATYLIVITPFLSRDESLPHRQRVGQVCSVLGAALLLLPTLWLSFNQENLQPTLILAGESLVLLLVGIGTRIRSFVLSGAGLVVVCAMHTLFLPSLGIPPSLALAILGGTLLAIATTLSLARHRLQAVWTRWE